jgi:hypothetical protein
MAMGMGEGDEDGMGMGEPPDTTEQAARLDEAVSWLEKAVEISRDYHVKTYNSGFLGGLVYSRGQRLGNAADAQRGRDLMEQLTREIPAFGYGTRGDVMNNNPYGTADWATALESYFRFFEVCTGTTIDRQNPDVSVVLRRPIVNPDSTCTNWSHAAHGIQGFLMMFADALVKNGQPAAARPVLQVIKQTDGFANWQFKSVVDERLAADLDARVLLYRNNDPAAQPPPLGAGGCLGCHQE